MRRRLALTLTDSAPRHNLPVLALPRGYPEHGGVRGGIIGDR